MIICFDFGVTTLRRLVIIYLYTLAISIQKLYRCLYTSPPTASDKLSTPASQKLSCSKKLLFYQQGMIATNTSLVVAGGSHCGAL
jgi:hypothetical protein